MHIMIDLETFGVHSTAPIITAGLAVFDPYAREIEETHSVALNIDQQKIYGRTASADTLAWWLRQAPEAQHRLADVLDVGRGGDLDAQLEKLGTYINTHLGDTGLVWGYGANEDIAWLSGLYDAADIPRPWHYRKVACYRTILRTFGAVGEDWFLPTIAHDAVADADAQARTLQAIVRRHNLKLEGA